MNTTETAAEIYIGVMSGTSLDGVDAVLCEIDASGKPRFLGRQHTPFCPKLRQDILALNSPGHNEIHMAAVVANELADLYANTINHLLDRTKTSSVNVRAVGVHGQTIRHQPDQGYTIQINAPARLAEQVRIDVVADFRSRDIAAGGQGAPLVPAFHAAVFSGDSTRVVLNLGGIANVTVLQPDAGVIGFDTGPANMLMDAWCEKHTGRTFDEDGAWGAGGRASDQLLQTLIASQPWFDLPAPKSTGRDMFNMGWLESVLGQTDLALSAQDVQATLQHLTASTVLDALQRTGLQDVDLFVCGGGARNKAVIKALLDRGARSVQTTEDLGIPAEDVEAIAFAWLAWAFINRKPANLPSVTGASGPRVLGALWPA